MAGIAAALVASVVVAFLSLAIGERSIPLPTVLHVLLHDDGSPAHYILWNVRLPRTLLGIVVGAALGVAGALMQALTRNPLADPGVLGINAGAGAAVSLSIALLGIRDLGTFVWFAFAGAAVAGVAMYLLATGGRGGASPVRLALAGMAVTAALTGLTQAAMLISHHTLDQMRFWTVGSLAKADFATLARVLPFLGFGLVLAMLLARPLNAIALGDDTGRALGAHLGRTLFGALVAVTVLCGAATAAVGPLVFVGLAVPHVARAITGPDQRWALPYCLVLTPILLLVADLIGRVITTQQLDVGVITSIIGAPLFIALVRRSKAVRS